MAHVPECWCSVCSAVKSAVSEEVAAKAKVLAKEAVKDVDVTDVVKAAVENATRDQPSTERGSVSREDATALPPRQALPGGAKSNMR